MYKLLNKLFGWDYISFSGYHGGVYRIEKDYNNNSFILIGMKATNIFDIKNVIWLTCPPDKYINKEKDQKK